MAPLLLLSSSIFFWLESYVKSSQLHLWHIKNEYLVKHAFCLMTSIPHSFCPSTCLMWQWGIGKEASQICLGLWICLCLWIFLCLWWIFWSLAPLTHKCPCATSCLYFCRQVLAFSCRVPWFKLLLFFLLTNLLALGEPDPPPDSRLNSLFFF